MLLGVTLQYTQWPICVYQMYFYGHVDSPNRKQLWSKSCRQQTSQRGFVGFKVTLAVTYKKKTPVLAYNIYLRASEKEAVQHFHMQLLCISKPSSPIAEPLLVPLNLAWETENSREKKRILTCMLSTIHRQTICTRLQTKCKPPLQKTCRDFNEAEKSHVNNKTLLYSVARVFKNDCIEPEVCSPPFALNGKYGRYTCCHSFLGYHSSD